MAQPDRNSQKDNKRGGDPNFNWRGVILFAIAFALIGLAVAGDSRSFREARIHPLITTMLIALFIRWEGFIAGNAAGDNLAFVPTMYAVPLIAMLVCIWVIATNKRLELPTRWTDRIQDFWTQRAMAPILRRRAKAEGER